MRSTTRYCYKSLEYELPKKWRFEEDEETLSLFDPNGNGAMTVSLYRTLPQNSSLEGQIVTIARKFVDNFGIILDHPFIMKNKDDSLALEGEGKTNDNWFIKIWVIGRHPKIAFVTYQSNTKTNEIKKCNLIVNSMRFLDK